MLKSLDVAELTWQAMCPEMCNCLARSPSSALLPFLGEGSPTKIDYREKGTLVLTSLLEDLVEIGRNKLTGCSAVSLTRQGTRVAGCAKSQLSRLQRDEGVA